VTPALLISDLHLSGERPAVSEQFFRFLRAEAARAQTLYVLGDLFEYWVGDDALDAAGGDALARGVAHGLRKLSDSGVAVWLMHGNRDFLVGSGFCEASGARLLDDPTLATVGGERTLLMHGDTLCTDEPITRRGAGRRGPESGNASSSPSRWPSEPGPSKACGRRARR